MFHEVSYQVLRRGRQTIGQSIHKESRMTTKWINTNWTLISRNTRINADTRSPFHFGRSKTSPPTETKDFKWHMNTARQYTGLYCEDKRENYEKKTLFLLSMYCVSHDTFYCRLNQQKQNPCAAEKNNAGGCAWPVRPTAIEKKDLLVLIMMKKGERWKNRRQGYLILLCDIWWGNSQHTFSLQRRIQQTMTH